MACTEDTSIAATQIQGLHGDWDGAENFWPLSWFYPEPEPEDPPWWPSYCFPIYGVDELEHSNRRIQTAAGLGAFVLQDDFYDKNDPLWWKRQLACSQRYRIQTTQGLRYILPAVRGFAGQSRRVCVKVSMSLIGGTPIDGSWTLVFSCYPSAVGPIMHYWGVEGAARNPDGEHFLWLSDAKDWMVPGEDYWYIYLATDEGWGLWKGPPIECLPNGPYVHEAGLWPDSGGMVEGGDASSHDEKEKDPEGPCPTCPDEPQMFIAPGVTCEDPPGGQCPAMWETWYRDPEYVTCHWDDRNFGTWRSNEDGLHQDEETGVWTFYLECFVCGFGAMYEGIIPNAPCPVGMFQKVSGSAEMPASVMIA